MEMYYYYYYYQELTQSISVNLTQCEMLMMKHNCIKLSIFQLQKQHKINNCVHQI